MDINQIKCKLITKLILLIIGILAICLISIIDSGFNMYKGIIIAVSFFLIAILKILFLKVRNQILSISKTHTK